MSAKTVLVFFVQALLAHITFSQCVYPGGDYLRAFAAPADPSCGARGGSGLAYGTGLGAGFSNGCADAGLSAARIAVAPTSGGGLPVISSSDISPTGLSVASENVFEGSLAVIGELPFLSAAALEGGLLSGGAGVVSYGCGNGVTAITSDVGSGAGAIGLGAAGIGYGPAIAGVAGLGEAEGYGCGCRGY